MLNVLENPSPHAVRADMPDWAGKPDLVKQRPGLLWRKDVRHIALFGGRGGGKSHAVARALVLQAAEEHHRVLCCREIQNSTKESVHRLLSDEIERCGLEKLFTITDSEIRGPHGSVFIFAGLRTNVSKIKSMEGLTDVWVEEAQTISQPSLDVLLPTVRAPGSRFFWTWNPGQPDDPIEQLFRHPEVKPPPGTVIRLINHDRNPWFPQELRDQMLDDRARDFDRYRHVWLGEFAANSNAKVFKRWQLATFETPVNAVRRFGLDFGFSVDPTACVSCFIGRWDGHEAIADENGRHLFIDYEAWEKHCELDKLPQLLDAVPGSREWQMVADSSRPETISHLRNKGFPKIAASIKGAGSVVEGVEFLKSFDIVVHDRCENTALELAAYQYKTDPRDPRVVLPQLMDKDNHVIDALRYACEGVRRAVQAHKKQEVNPANSPRSSVSAFAKRR